MGVSFKINKVGTRFCPKPLPAEKPAVAGDDEDGDNNKISEVPDRDGSSLSASSKRKHEDYITQVGEDALASPVSFNYCGEDHSTLDQELSFTLDLFPDGFSIGKPTENGTLEPLFREVPKSLYPYNRSSETLFSAIEMGRLPGDILDDIPSKYINGSVFCEVRDYRKCINEPGTVGSIVDGLPIVHIVRLRMSLENVVKDIPSMSDDSWTYGDLMEVESRIVKAIQPQLHLDPTPMLDRLCETPISSKLDLGISQARKKRLKQMAEVIVTSNSQTHGKKVSIERIHESTNCKFGEIGPSPGDGTMQHVHDNLAVQPSVATKSFGQDVSRASLPFSGQAKIQSTISYPRHYQDRGSGMPPTTLSTNTNNGLAASQEMINSYNESSRNLHGRRENQDTQMSHMSGMKRTNQAPSLDGLVQHPQVASTLDSIHGTDVSWKTSMSQHQIDTRGIQYSNIEGPKYPIGDARQAIPEASSNQEGVSPFYLDQRMLRHGIKEERMETESTAKQEIDSLIAGTGASQINQLQRQSQQAFVRSHFPSQTQWHNLGTLVEKDPRRDEPLQKRRPAQSPRFSGGAVVQPPASSKSGDNSSGSMGPHCGPVSSAQGSQKDKATAISGDSVHWQHQSSGKRKPSSVSKNPAIGGVASPASVSNVNIPMNASSPSVGTPPMADQILLDRFSKIDAVTTRYQLNGKKKKVEDYPMMKRPNYFSQEVSNYLSNSVNNEDVIDSNSSNPMSSSLIGGSLNTCKSRIINFMQPERIYQGNGVSIVLPRSRDRLTLIERSRDGMVALVRGEIDENEYMPFLEHIPAFPNTNYADLLCAQFSTLMVREGYQIMDDQIRAAPTRIGNASFGPSNTAAVSSDIAPSENQYRENVSGQLPSTVSPANSGLTPMTQSQNVLSSPRLLSPGNVQSVQMSQGYLPGGGIPARPPQLEQTQLPPQPSQQSQIQQNQHAPMQKSLLLQSSLSNIGAIGQNANLNMSNPMMNKAAASLQLRLLQQQQQQQQQPQMARKMMMGLGGAMGMGNLGNSVVGMGGVRGMGPGISAPMGLTSGISAPMGMGPIAGVGSMGQNPINLSQASNITNMLNQHIRSGSLSPAQATAMASKLMQSRGLGTQTGIAGMSGSGQMHGGSPFSMLGQNLNRGNMNPMQRTAMATMGPPKIPGMNAYMNQQQQMQLQPQQLQQLQQHQQFQQLQQQQQHHHQQQQQQQQLQQQQQQLQQQQQQQQQMSSPLQNQQAILSPPQVGSPAMAIQQQLSQQQQIGSPQVSQQNPMSPQLSAGALQQMNNVGNSGLTPASPQLSSQTLGSVGSISSSPMELQGVNKGNSINNV